MRRSYHRNTGEASPCIVFEAARDSDAVTHIRTVVADLQYSTDGLHWSNWAIGTDLTIDKNSKVYVRGKHSSTSGSPWFETEGSMLLKVSGNANALNDWENPDELVGLSGLFILISHLEDASELLLPATTLVNNCYDSMFCCCVNLVNAPALPATTLAHSCYAYMFNRCSSLVKAPKLPATTLVTKCYYRMFENCTSLDEVWCATEEYTGVNIEYYTYWWLKEVAPTGTFHCKEGFKSIWPIDDPSGVPTGWTISDGTEVNVGDILYYTDGELKSIPYTSWQSSLGTPVAVCVIPQLHDVYGNGKAGWIAVHGVNEDGSHATSEQTMRWNNGSDTPLTKFTKVPAWNNDGQPSTTDNTYGYLPSDHITDTTKAQCNGDITARYNSTSNMIPSPYVNGERRADYYREISEGNALSDFNGKDNTDILVASDTEAKAAIACSLYSDAELPAGSWYLPAMGELGYCAPRLEVIQAALAACGGVALNANFHWSSTQYASIYAWYYRPSNGIVTNYHVTNANYVRPFLAY